MRPSRGWQVVFVVVVGLQLFALYWPRVDVPGAPGYSDTLVHTLLFAVPAFVGVMAWLSWWPVIVLAVHAPVSECLQAALLPDRSGAVGDVVADLAGVALGSLLAVVFVRRAAREPGSVVRS